MTVEQGVAGRRFEDLPDDLTDGLSGPPTAEELAGLSPFAELERAVQENEAVRQPIDLPVPMRPGVEITYDPNIDGEILAVWRRRCQVKEKGQVVDFNSVKFAEMILVETCAGVKIGGREVLVDGAPLTFNHMDLRILVAGKGKPPAVNAGHCARLMYGGKRFSGDGNMMETANDVLEAAGYAPELGDRATGDDDGDPTSAPSRR